MEQIGGNFTKCIADRNDCLGDYAPLSRIGVAFAALSDTASQQIARKIVVEQMERWGEFIGTSLASRASGKHEPIGEGLYASDPSGVDHLLTARS
jgi:hypothetical protein